MIIHTQDQEYALGAVTQPRQPTSSGVPGQSGALYSSTPLLIYCPGLHYAYFSFNIQPFDQKTFKWSVVIREDLVPGLVFQVMMMMIVMIIMIMMAGVHLPVCRQPGDGHGLSHGH